MVIEYIENPQCNPDVQLKIMMDIPIVHQNVASPFAEFKCICDILGALHMNDVLTSEMLLRPYNFCVYK